MEKIDFQKKIEDSFAYLKKGEIYRTIIDDTEKILVEKALEQAHGNQILAARVLGLNRNTIRSKIKKFHLNPVKFKECRL